MVYLIGLRQCWEIGCVLTLRIIHFVYCKVNKRWSGKLWQRQWGLKREDNRVFPLVTIDSSGDIDAGRDINSFAPLVTSVYSIGTEEPDAIRKLYPLIIGNPENEQKWKLYFMNFEVYSRHWTWTLCTYVDYYLLREMGTIIVLFLFNINFLLWWWNNFITSSNV